MKDLRFPKLCLNPWVAFSELLSLDPRETWTGLEDGPDWDPHGGDNPTEEPGLTS